MPARARSATRSTSPISIAATLAHIHRGGVDCRRAGRGQFRSAGRRLERRLRQRRPLARPGADPRARRLLRQRPQRRLPGRRGARPAEPLGADERGPGERRALRRADRRPGRASKRRGPTTSRGRRQVDDPDVDLAAAGARPDRGPSARTPPGRRACCRRRGPPGRARRAARRGADIAAAAPRPRGRRQRRRRERREERFEYALALLSKRAAGSMAAIRGAGRARPAPGRSAGILPARGRPRKAAARTPPPRPRRRSSPAAAPAAPPRSTCNAGRRATAASCGR